MNSLLYGGDLQKNKQKVEMLMKLWNEKQLAIDSNAQYLLLMDYYELLKERGELTPKLKTELIEKIVQIRLKSEKEGSTRNTPLPKEAESIYQEAKACQQYIYNLDKTKLSKPFIYHQTDKELENLTDKQVNIILNSDLSPKKIVMLLLLANKTDLAYQYVESQYPSEIKTEMDEEKKEECDLLMMSVLIASNRYDLIETKNLNMVYDKRIYQKASLTGCECIIYDLYNKEALKLKNKEINIPAFWEELSDDSWLIKDFGSSIMENFFKNNAHMEKITSIMDELIKEGIITRNSGGFHSLKANQEFLGLLSQANPKYHRLASYFYYRQPDLLDGKLKPIFEKYLLTEDYFKHTYQNGMGADSFLYQNLSQDNLPLLAYLGNWTNAGNARTTSSAINKEQFIQTIQKVSSLTEPEIQELYDIWMKTNRDDVKYLVSLLQNNEMSEFLKVYNSTNFKKITEQLSRYCQMYEDENHILLEGYASNIIQEKITEDGALMFLSYHAQDEIKKILDNTITKKEFLNLARTAITRKVEHVQRRGPTSKGTSFTYDREITIISSSGKIEVLNANIQNGHPETLMHYNKSQNLQLLGTQVGELAPGIANKKNGIVLVIEGAVCLTYVTDALTELSSKKFYEYIENLPNFDKDQVIFGLFIPGQIPTNMNYDQLKIKLDYEVEQNKKKNLEETTRPAIRH